MAAPLASPTSIDGRRLLAQLITAALVICGVNSAVTRLTANSVPRQMLRHGETIRPATELFLGNSTMAAGIDETIFAAVKSGRPLNLGLGSTSPVEHFLLLRRQPIGTASNVFYGFFDTQLTDPVVGDWEKLVGNRAMSYYVDPEVAVGFYAGDRWWSAWKLRLVGRVPILFERAAVWAKVEVARRFVGEIGMPKQAVNRFGRAADFALLEEELTEFTQRCREAVEQEISFSRPITALLEHVKKVDAKLYLVEMPMTSNHRSRYHTGRNWKAYRARIEKLADKAGIEIIAASDWIDDSGFADSLHLNASGAEQFSRRLANSYDENRSR